MKQTFRVAAFVSLLVLLALPVLAAKPVIAVKTFENPPNYYNSTVGTGLTDMFITELQKTGHYSIIERAQVKQLTDEVDFGKSGYVEQQSAVRKGHIKGVQYYFLAKVTNFGAKKKKVGGGGWGKSVFGGLGYKKDEAYVRIDYRIIDATSGETVYADYGEGTYANKGISFGGGKWGSGGGNLNVDTDEFRDSMVGRATTIALNNIIDKMDHTFLEKAQSRAEQLAQEEADAQQQALEELRKVPGNVLAAISKDMVIVSLGSNNGIQVGDKMTLIRSHDIKNSEGQVVYSEEKEVGTLEVFEVQADRSKVRVISGETPKEGDTVKVQ